MFRFDEFRECHLTDLRAWLNQDHVRPFWQEPDDPAVLREKFLNELGARGVHGFVFGENGGAPLGFIQYYEAAKVGGGWWPGEPAGTFGIDLMIGDPGATGRGVASRVIEDFTSFLRAREPGVRSFIIDPDPRNTRAIRAFAKAGFCPSGEITTPGGPALLMRRRA